jgi:hypothetical protein
MHPDLAAVALVTLSVCAILALPWREADLVASVRALRSLARLLRPAPVLVGAAPERDLLPAPLAGLVWGGVAQPVRVAG